MNFAARLKADREAKALEATKSVQAAQGKGSVEQEKMEDKVTRKLDQKRREQQMMKDVETLMASLPEMQRKFAGEQIAQDERLDGSERQLQKLQSDSDKLQAELKAYMVMVAATAEGMSKLEASVGLIGQNATGGMPADMGDRFSKMEGLFDQLSGLGDRFSKMEGLFDQLSGLGELKDQIEEHSTKLAEIFTRKASKVSKHDKFRIKNEELCIKKRGILYSTDFCIKTEFCKDELDAMKNSMKGMGDSFASQLAKAAGDIVKDLNETKESMAGSLSGLFAQMGGKVDTLWVDDLERQLRDEIERLARLGRGAVDQDALDAKLAALRAALEAELNKADDEASGSAAFRCLLCDRPLPPKEEWKLKQRSNLSASMPHSHEEVERGYGSPHTAKVSFQWKNVDFLLKNVDFILKNVDFIIEQHAKAAGGGGGMRNNTSYAPVDREDFDPEVVYRAGFPTMNRPSSKGSMHGSMGGMTVNDMSLSGVDSSAGGRGMGGFAPMASHWGGQRGMPDSRSGRNLPPVDASGRPVEVMRSGRAHAKASHAGAASGVPRSAGALRESQLDNSLIRLDGQGPSLPGFEPWGGQHAGQQRPRTSGAY